MEKSLKSLEEELEWFLKRKKDCYEIYMINLSNVEFYDALINKVQKQIAALKNQD